MRRERCRSRPQLRNCTEYRHWIGECCHAWPSRTFIDLHQVTELDMTQSLVGTSQTKSARLIPKTRPFRGSLQSEWKRCGKPNCRCRNGSLHGPYWYRHWRERGRQRKQYVPRDQALLELQEESMIKADFPSVWSAKRSLTELRRKERELNQ